MTLARNEAERYMRARGYSDNLFKKVGIVPLDNVVNFN